MIKPNRVFKKKRHIKREQQTKKHSRTRTKKEECSKTHENKTKKLKISKTKKKDKHAKNKKMKKMPNKKGSRRTSLFFLFAKVPKTCFHKRVIDRETKERKGKHL